MKIGLIAGVLLIGGVAYFGYAWVKGPSYGISDSRPLGNFDTIDSYLKDRKFVREDIDEESIPEEFEGIKGYKYVDVQQTEDNSGFEEHVKVFVGSSGDVQGLSGQWMKPPETHQMHSTRTMLFLVDYWPKAGGESPVKFKSRVEGTGNFGIEVKFARFKSDKVSGLWERRKSPYPLESMLFYTNQ